MATSKLLRSEFETEFSDLLRPTFLEPTRYAGALIAGRGSRAFGGHVAAQMLAAGAATVDESRRPVSLHVVFSAAADSTSHAVYTVEKVHDGRTLSTRCVVAHQDTSLRAVATCTFSEPLASPQHQPPCPDYPQPDACVPVDHVVPGLAAGAARFLELRVAEVAGAAGVPEQVFWARLRHPIRDRISSAAALAYLSDLALSHAADRPHRSTPGTRRGASLDHTVHFHSSDAAWPALGDGWHLVRQHGVAYGSGLAVGRSEIFRDSGHLIATCSQQSFAVRE